MVTKSVSVRVRCIGKRLCRSFNIAAQWRAPQPLRSTIGRCQLRIVTTALLIAITITTCPVQANDPLDTHQVSDASQPTANPFGKPKSGEAGSASPDASPMGGPGAQGGTSARRNPFARPGQPRSHSPNGIRSESGDGYEQLPNSQAPSATSEKPPRSANPFTNAKNPPQPPPGPSSKGPDQMQKSLPPTTLTSNQDVGGTRILYYCGEYRFLKKSSPSRKVAPGESPGQNNSAMARADANTFNNEDDCDPDSGILLSIYKFDSQAPWRFVTEALFVAGANDNEVRANIPASLRAIARTRGYSGNDLSLHSLRESMTCRKRGWVILVYGEYANGGKDVDRLRHAWGCLTGDLAQSFDIAVRHHRKVFPGARILEVLAWRLDKASYRQFSGKLWPGREIVFRSMDAIHFKPSATVECPPIYTDASGESAGDSTSISRPVHDINLCAQVVRQFCGAGITPLDCRVQMEAAYFKQICAVTPNSPECGPRYLSERFQNLRATEIVDPR